MSNIVETLLKRYEICPCAPEARKQYRVNYGGNANKFQRYRGSAGGATKSRTKKRNDEISLLFPFFYCFLTRSVFVRSVGRPCRIRTAQKYESGKNDRDRPEDISISFLAKPAENATDATIDLNHLAKNLVIIDL